MTENAPVPPIHQSPDEQSTEGSPPTIELVNIKTPHSKNRSIFQKFFDAFTPRRRTDEDEQHPLYDEYEPLARSIKITSQMLIGIIIGFSLLLKVIAIVFNLIGIPLLYSLAILSPLDIVGYGLFFSTGVDLAYMLFTPGPDEAIDPLMTGLAAAILLGIGQIDYKQIQVQHGLVLFLAVGALAGLFAIKKYLYIHPPEKTRNDMKNDIDTGLK